MEELLQMIGERGLSIAFSDYIVRVIDPTNRECTYIEYHAPPVNRNRQYRIFPDRQAALLAALRNCQQRVLPATGDVMITPV